MGAAALPETRGAETPARVWGELVYLAPSPPTLGPRNPSVPAFLRPSPGFSFTLLPLLEIVDYNALKKNGNDFRVYSTHLELTTVYLDVMLCHFT